MTLASSRARLCRLLACALMLAVSTPLKAQNPSSAIADLLQSAKDALNDLRFARADTIAREILGRASLRRSQTVLAWQIVAAASFPEEGTRDTVAARAAMREVIRLDLDAAFPIDIKWAGLDALLSAEKQRAPGMAVRVAKAETIYGGSAGDAIVRVATSLPTSMWLLARADGGSNQIVLDSAVNSREATFRIAALRGVTPVLPTGAYEFVVRSTELQSGVTLERTLQASVTAPALEFVPVPAAVDTTHLLPEIRKPNRTRGIAAGVAFGALTVAMGSFLRSAEPIKSATSDGRTVGVGFVIALGTGVAVWFDRGQPITRNRESNAELRAVNAKVIVDAKAENERRVSGYRAKLTLLMEDK